MYMSFEKKAYISKYNKDKMTPFILVIEDINNVDSYSIGFLDKLMEEVKKGKMQSLNPFIVIFSYTISLYKIKFFKPDEDNFNIATKFIERFKDFTLLTAEEDLDKPVQFYIQNFDLDNIENYIKYY